MNSVEYFESKGYVRVDNFLDEVTVNIISQYMENKIRRREWVQDYNSADEPTSYYYYADPLIEVLLLKCKGNVEQVVGKELLPTYSYSRVYQPGEYLKRHIDRPECEISVTVNVGLKGEISPFYTEYKNNKIERHMLKTGDAIIYKGCEVFHWRDQLKVDQLVVQFMLHYVDKNGSHCALDKDSRDLIGTDASHKRTN